MALLSAAQVEPVSSRSFVSMKSPCGRPQRVYIVDPLGNLMMYYQPDADARGMLRDLQKSAQILEDRLVDRPMTSLVKSYLGLCKLKVVALIVFTAMVGMFLATNAARHGAAGCAVLRQSRYWHGGSRGGGHQSCAGCARGCQDDAHQRPAACRRARSTGETRCCSPLPWARCPC